MADPASGAPREGGAIPAECLHLADAAATGALGRRLAQWLQPLCRPGQAPLLLLQGDLGAGKTCLVQGLAEGLGVDEPITSPTFALAQHYRGGSDEGDGTWLVHLDLYRLETGFSADELFAQEEEEARALGGLMAVEWPERLSERPLDAWLVRLEWLDPERPEVGRQAWITRPR